jgi:hypothetical protein
MTLVEKENNELQLVVDVVVDQSGSKRKSRGSRADRSLRSDMASFSLLREYMDIWMYSTLLKVFIVSYMDLPNGLPRTSKNLLFHSRHLPSIETQLAQFLGIVRFSPGSR